MNCLAVWWKLGGKWRENDRFFWGHGLNSTCLVAKNMCVSGGNYSTKKTFSRKCVEAKVKGR
jgi:hypothetical protein